MHPVAAFLIGLSVMGIFFSVVQKSPTREDLPHALRQRHTALVVIFEKFKKLEKQKK